MSFSRGSLENLKDGFKYRKHPDSFGFFLHLGSHFGKAQFTKVVRGVWTIDWNWLTDVWETIFGYLFNQSDSKIFVKVHMDGNAIGKKLTSLIKGN